MIRNANKKERNLSGIFVPAKNRRYVCIEELTPKELVKYIESRDNKWLQYLCIKLCGVIKEIGNQFDIEKE